MKSNYKILAINPGSTSTKISVYLNEKSIMDEVIEHPKELIQQFNEIYDQFEYRKKIIIKTLEEKNIDLFTLDVVVARGGNCKPVKGGTYQVNSEMLEDLRIGVMGQHASNLGGIIAHAIAKPLNIKAYVVDPVIVDEFEPIARISGTPEIQRKSKDHPLNQKAVGRKAAEKMGGRYEDFNFIIAHMGGGVSVGVHKKGKMIDVNNCLDGDGPMSPERSGGIPFGSLIDICYSQKYTKDQLRKMLIGGGGLTAYLGTNDAREIVKRIEAGDEKAKLIYEAMAYQISKEIAGGGAVLKGEVDRILLTGGLAHDSLLVGWIKERVSFIAPIMIFPGENEMEAMTMGVLRVINGVENLQIYPNQST